jgi:hypothetical protein
MGPYVGAERYGICSVSPGLTARRPGNADNGAPRRCTYPRMFLTEMAMLEVASRPTPSTPSRRAVSGGLRVVAGRMGGDR